MNKELDLCCVIGEALARLSEIRDLAYENPELNPSELFVLANNKAQRAINDLIKREIDVLRNE